MTVVLAKDATVTANFAALVGPNETRAPKIVAAIRELAKKKTP